MGIRERSRRWGMAIRSEFVPVLSWSSETWNSSWRLGQGIRSGGREGAGGVRGRLQGTGVEVGVGRENLHWVKLWEITEEEEEEVEDSH